MASLNFNATEQKAINGGGGGDTLQQPGDYKVVVTDTELKTTKAGNGQYLETRIECIEGEQMMNHTTVRFNIENTNPKAVEIGRGQLTALCNAVGKPQVNDSAELHDIPFIVRMKPRKMKPDELAQYGQQFEAGSFYSLESAPAPTVAPAAMAAAQKPAAASAAPWAR